MNREQINPEDSLEHTGQGKVYPIVNIAVFFLLIFAGGAMSLVLPGEKISESEKRMLAPVPQFSWNSLFYGGYTDSLDLYYADNFPYRTGFLNMSGGVRGWFGILDHELGIYNVASL